LFAGVPERLIRKARVMKQYAGLKVCTVLAAFAIMGVAGVAEADFVIILRNGSDIKVSEYRDVGNHIVYERYGGKISISKTRVEAIKNLETGEKRVFGGSHTAQEPKVTPRVTRPPARKSPAKPAYAQEALWNELNDRVDTLYEQGRYTEMAQVAKEALKVAENTFGPDHPNLATSLNNLAELYRRLQGKYAAAEPLYQRALAIYEKALGPDHPDVATSLNNLALLYYTQGKYAEAEPLFKRALGIREKALGPSHPDVAQSLNNLALLYAAQGKYAAAEPLYKRALAIYEKALGPDHPDVATSLNNLAGLYQAQGKYAEAEPLYQRALAIWEKALGPDHPQVATVLKNMARLYKEAGRVDEAIRWEKRANAIRSRNQ
jgi:tetratricopeptide (TPR) repeat protein